VPLIRASTVADANLVPTAAPAMALAALRLPAPRTAATRCSPWMIDIDGERAHPAMVDNDLLGGCTSFGVDRALTAQLAAAVPDVGEMARAGRAFLRHAVRYLVASGIQQFLDIGCGLATPGCVHHLALRSAPSARVVCVDIDPIVVVHNERALAGNPHAAVLHADARQPDMILNHPTVNAVLDFGDPVAVMLLSTLDLVRDDEDPTASWHVCATHSGRAATWPSAISPPTADRVTSPPWPLWPGRPASSRPPAPAARSRTCSPDSTLSNPAWCGRRNGTPTTKKTTTKTTTQTSRPSDAACSPE